jgi:hypothetical protein
MWKPRSNSVRHGRQGLSIKENINKRVINSRPLLVSHSELPLCSNLTPFTSRLKFIVVSRKLSSPAPLQRLTFFTLFIRIYLCLFKYFTRGQILPSIKKSHHNNTFFHARLLLEPLLTIFKIIEQ